MKSVGGAKATKNGILPPIVFINGRPEPLAFYVKGLHNYNEFYDTVPRPKPTAQVFKKDEGWVTDDKSAAYIDQLREWGRLRYAWITMKTLEPSNIVWTDVDPKNPKTWGNVHKELEDTLTDNEYIILMEAVEEANTLNKQKLEEYRETFFQRREASARGASQDSGAANTQSGAPAPA